MIEEHGNLLQIFPDDTTTYLGLNPTSEFSTTLAQVSHVLYKIKMWVHSNFLKLKIDKKGVLVCGKSVTLNIYRPWFSLFEKISGISYRQSDDVQVLGLVVVERLDFEKMVSQTCKPSYYSLHKLYDLRRYFYGNLKMTLVKILVVSSSASSHSLKFRNNIR